MNTPVSLPRGEVVPSQTEASPLEVPDATLQTTTVDTGEEQRLLARGGQQGQRFESISPQLPDPSESLNQAIGDGSLENPYSPAVLIGEILQGARPTNVYYRSAHQGEPKMLQEIRDPDLTVLHLRHSASTEQSYRIGGANNPMSLSEIARYEALAKQAFNSSQGLYVRGANGESSRATASQFGQTHYYATEQAGVAPYGAGLDWRMDWYARSGTPIPLSELAQVVSLKLDEYGFSQDHLEDLLTLSIAENRPGVWHNGVFSIPVDATGYNRNRNGTVVTNDRGVFQINSAHVNNGFLTDYERKNPLAAADFVIGTLMEGRRNRGEGIFADFTTSDARFFNNATYRNQARAAIREM